MQGSILCLQDDVNKARVSTLFYLYFVRFMGKSSELKYVDKEIIIRGYGYNLSLLSTLAYNGVSG